MGVRTRLDIKAGAAKLKADRAARLEVESSTAGIVVWPLAGTFCGRQQSGPRW
jgi:hypothetical protein